MIGRVTKVLAVLAVCSVGTLAARANAQVGKAAPDFRIKDSNGKTVSLADLRGKTIVLEWINHGCPFVRKHYGSGNMQKLQRQYTQKGVVWLSVISSAPGKQGHSTPDQANAKTKDVNAAPTAVLLDESGQMGRAYGARTTPHMFVINPQGTLVYNGGLDDRASTNLDDINGARNYVAAAVDATLKGQAVETPVSQPYGCGVKY